MRITKVVTKRGDAGFTYLSRGERVKKSDLRIECYGTIDELNSIIGIIRSLNPSKKIDSVLDSVQNSLFVMGSDLSTKYPFSAPRIKKNHIKFLEKKIDEYLKELPHLKEFILPGGLLVSSYLHFARTVARRAERKIVLLEEKEKINKNILVYLNRLSDLFFILARYLNLNKKVKEKYAKFSRKFNYKRALCDKNKVRKGSQSKKH